MKITPVDPYRWRSLLWAAARGSTGLTVGGLGAVFAFLAWLFPASNQVPLYMVAVVVYPLLAAAIVLVQCVLIARDNTKPIIPAIKSAKALTTGGKERFLLLLAPSQLFSHGFYVSIYLVEEDNYERLVGTGRVVNIQDDGLIQVLVDEGTTFAQDFGELTRNQNGQFLKKLRVKPFTQHAGL